jgi:tetratricopeptide (TPR) repeat protein
MADKNDLIWQRITQYQKLLAQARAKHDQEAEGHALAVLDHCYLHLEMWQEAGEYFTQALTLYQQSGERLKQGDTLVNLGEVLRFPGSPTVGVGTMVSPTVSVRVG